MNRSIPSLGIFDKQCYTIDCLMSINHGQRSAIPLENIETLMPDRSATLLHKMKYEVCRLELFYVPQLAHISTCERSRHLS